MSPENMMWLLLVMVLLLVGSPIIWMFARKQLIKLGWLSKLSKLDNLALDHDLRGYWERQLASQCVTGAGFITVFGGLLLASALYSSINFGQPAILISGFLGFTQLGSAIRQLFLGWERASQSRYVKQMTHLMELRRENLSRHFGEEIAS